MWLAAQIAKEVQSVGAAAFLDERDIPKGASDIKRIIRDEIWASRELLALFTPWSVMRSWVWIEIGAAWNLELPILAVFYGVTLDDLDKTGQGKAILDSMNTIQLNDLNTYVRQLAGRVTKTEE